MQPSRIKTRERVAGERVRDFLEVDLGYTQEQVQQEAARCLGCRKRPCIRGCPVGVNIPEFIRAMADGDVEQAIGIVKEKNSLPAVCSRLCRREEHCEKYCILGKKEEPVAIGHLERYAADWETANRRLPTAPPAPDASEPRVAVVGSGPAGLTCAGELARQGFNVTIFESLHAAGGMLRRGIPEFRLPKALLDHELDHLRELGVSIVTGASVGRTIPLDDLIAGGYEAVFLRGGGGGTPKFMGLPGENLNNVYPANDFLERISLMDGHRFAGGTSGRKVKRVAVIGGGSGAIDSARSALRMGAEKVMLVYRRSREEMSARPEEVRHADEEGIQCLFRVEPVAFRGDDRGFVREMECVRTEPGEPDASGRRTPRPVAGPGFTVPVDRVIVAIGLSPDQLPSPLTRGLEMHPWGQLKIDDEFMTSRRGVFAGGDIPGGETVIREIAMGKQTAQSIKNYLLEKRVEC